MTFVVTDNDVDLYLDRFQLSSSGRTVSEPQRKSIKLDLAAARSACDKWASRRFWVGVDSETHIYGIDSDSPQSVDYLEVHDLYPDAISESTLRIKILKGVDVSTKKTYPEQDLLFDRDYIIVGHMNHVYPVEEIIFTGSGQSKLKSGCKISVQGSFGWPEVPPEVQVCSMEYAAVMRFDSDRATSQVNFGSGAVQTIPAKTQQLLVDYLSAYRRVWVKESA